MKGQVKVGQELCCVNSDHRRGPGRPVTIKKIGRVWLTVDNGYGRDWRVDPESLRVDGGQHQSPGQCYLSEAEYLSERDRNRAWQSLKLWFRDAHHAPNHVTTAAMKAIQAILDKPA